MLRFIAGRLIVVLSVGLTLSIVTFFLLNYVIDPAQAIAGEDALFEEIEQISCLLYTSPSPRDS